MIAPQLFPQLGIGDGDVLISSNSSLSNIEELPSGVYELDYGGGGGGGQGQYFSYPWPQGAGKRGRTQSREELHITHRDEFLGVAYIGAGGSINQKGGNTRPHPSLPVATGGSEGTFDANGNLGLSSAPATVPTQSGMKSFTEPRNEITSTNRCRGGRGYSSSGGSASSGFTGYIRIRRVR